ncbi:unnamed protein product, partial [Ectocarpus sp. 12 AP-2014]
MKVLRTPRATVRPAPSPCSTIREGTKTTQGERGERKHRQKQTPTSLPLTNKRLGVPSLPRRRAPLIPPNIDPLSPLGRPQSTPKHLPTGLPVAIILSIRNNGQSDGYLNLVRCCCYCYEREGKPSYLCTLVE